MDKDSKDAMMKDLEEHMREATKKFVAPKKADVSVMEKVKKCTADALELLRDRGVISFDGVSEDQVDFVKTQHNTKSRLGKLRDWLLFKTPLRKLSRYKWWAYKTGLMWDEWTSLDEAIEQWKERGGWEAYDKPTEGYWFTHHDDPYNTLIVSYHFQPKYPIKYYVATYSVDGGL